MLPKGFETVILEHCDFVILAFNSAFSMLERRCGMGKLGSLQEKKHTRTKDSNCNDKYYAEHCFVWAFTAGFRTNRA